ncbi:hypothetical protein [Chromobacterium phragmitis]|uniref:Lipoprotein n=1 Tax=Chromobacterium phragmitis TaxID=2202141 RepID=A0ABV0IV26_9NEIS
MRKSFKTLSIGSILIVIILAVLFGAMGRGKDKYFEKQSNEKDLSVIEQDISEDGVIKFDGNDFDIAIMNGDPQLDISIGVQGYSQDSTEKGLYSLLVKIGCFQDVKKFTIGFDGNSLRLKGHNCPVDEAKALGEIQASDWDNFNKFTVYYMYGGGGRLSGTSFCKQGTGYSPC